MKGARSCPRETFSCFCACVGPRGRDFAGAVAAAACCDSAVDACNVCAQRRGPAECRRRPRAIRSPAGKLPRRLAPLLTHGKPALHFMGSRQFLNGERRREFSAIKLDSQMPLVCKTYPDWSKLSRPTSVLDVSVATDHVGMFSVEDFLKYIFRIWPSCFSLPCIE